MIKYNGGFWQLLQSKDKKIGNEKKCSVLIVSSAVSVRSPKVNVEDALGGKLNESKSSQLINKDVYAST